MVWTMDISWCFESNVLVCFDFGVGLCDRNIHGSVLLLGVTVDSIVFI